MYKEFNRNSRGNRENPCWVFGKRFALKNPTNRIIILFRRGTNRNAFSWLNLWGKTKDKEVK